MRVKPASGRECRDERYPHRLIPEDGANVPLSAYYQRRLEDGSIVEGVSPVPAPPELKPKTPKRRKASTRTTREDGQT